MIPDHFEPLIGYRVWGVHHNGLMIGHGVESPWAPYQATQASCYCDNTGSHLTEEKGQLIFLEAPLLSCTCGIYAYLNLDMAVIRAREALQLSKEGWRRHMSGGSAGTPGLVWGSVKLWGRVIVHELGYRAEWGYPFELHTNSEYWARRVRAVYGVPCDVIQIFDEQEWEKKQRERIRNLFGDVFLMPSGSKLYFKTAPAPVPAPVTPKPLFIPSLAQIKALGATRDQKHASAQALRASAHKLLSQGDDWRQMMQRAFKTKAAGGTS